MNLAYINGFNVVTLKKISDNSFPIHKEVVICGKGFTSTKIKDSNLTDKIVCCLNSATLLVDSVDYLFMTDWERFVSLLKNEKNFSKIRNIVIPVQLQERCEPSLRFTYRDVVSSLRKYNINLYTFSLPEHPRQIKIPSEKTDTFVLGPDKIHSTFHISLLWLIKAGFKNFTMYGISKNPEYAQLFKQLKDESGGQFVNGRRVKTPESWFTVNFAAGVEIMDRNGCNYKFN